MSVPITHFVGKLTSMFSSANTRTFRVCCFVGRFSEIFFNPGLLGMCALVTKNDLEYWGIDELLLEPCCALRYYPEIELCVKEVEGEEISRKKVRERKEQEDFGDSKLGRVRKYLWNMTEYPETSKAAQVSISFDNNVFYYCFKLKKYEFQFV